MCNGENGEPDQCPAARDVKCIHCGWQWSSVDVFNPGRCPHCLEYGFRIERCEICPIRALDDARENSQAGKLLGRLLELEFNSERFRIGWNEVTATEARGLHVLKSERDRKAEEDRQ